MDTLTLAALTVSTAATAAAAHRLVDVAAVRSAAQPVPTHVDEEQTLLASLCQDLRRAGRIAAELNLDADELAEQLPGWFAWEPHRHVADVVAQAAVHPAGAVEVFAVDGDTPTGDDLSVPFDLPEWPVDPDDADNDLIVEAFELVRTQAAAGVGDELFDETAGKVWSAWDERSLTGTTKIVAADVPTRDRPLRREVPSPTGARRARSVVLTAAATAAGVIAASAAVSGVSLWLAAAAVSVLMCAGLVISLVDIDTLYLDKAVFWPAAGVSLAAAVGAAATSGEPERVVPGLIAVVLLTGMFEGTAWAFKKLRGVNGLGLGDTIMLLATVGVPSIVTGSLLVGLWGVLAGLGAGIVHHVWRMGTGAADRSTPFAFAPYLAYGWPFGWLVAALFPAVVGM